MDIIKQSRALAAKLEEAQKLAVELRDAMENTDPMDVVYIGLALDTVTQRIGYHENLKKKAAEAETAKEKKE